MEEDGLDFSSIDPGAGGTDMANPYPASAGGDASDPSFGTGSINPGLQSYLSMLMGSQSQGGAGTPTPQAFAPVGATAAPGTALTPLTAGAAPAWLGLGISGQKAQLQPYVNPGVGVNYTPPPAPQKSSSGGGGIGGIVGGFL